MKKKNDAATVNHGFAKRALMLLLALGLVSYGFSQQDEDLIAYEHNLSSDDVDLHFKVIRQPQFPESLRSAGHSKGHVRMLLELHFDGELRDWIVTSASHKDFADAIERVIEDWEFSPPKRNGKPISLVIPIEVNFRSTGDVVSFNMTDGLNHYLQFTSKANAIELADVDNLDQFPEPIYVVEPKVPGSLVRKSDGSFGVFKFFIDTEGRVRLPHVDSVRGGTVDVRLLEAAQDALEEWQFAPPTVNGKRVVVQVKQPFHFTTNR